MRFSFMVVLCGTMLISGGASTRAPAAVKADAKATAPVTIKVLSAEGAPVEGALIRVSPVKMRDGKGIIEARSDAAGVAKIAVPVRDSENETVGYVMVAAPEIGVQNGIVKRGDNVFSLLKAAPIGGRVLDATGKPLAGATVVVTTAFFENEDSASPRFISLRDMKQNFTAKTDAEGKWKFLGLPAGARITVVLQDERFETAVAFVVAGQSDAYDLVARPGATLEGAVVDADGKPVAGAKLFAQTDDYQSTGRAESDAAGRYRIASLKTGSYAVSVFSVPGQKLVAPALPNVAVESGASTRAPDIVMTPGALIQGVVRDEKGAPVAGISIEAKRDESNSFYGETDDAGKYQVRVLPGEVRLISDNAQGDDFYAEGAGARDKPVRLTLKAGETATQDFAVKRALTLFGVTVDQSGKPVVGARIFVGDDRYGLNAVSDADGKWQLPGQRPGKVKLNVTGEWQLTAPAEIALPRTEPLRLTLRATPFQSVAARVVTQDGKPIEGARVLAQLRQPVNFGGDGPQTFTMRALEAKSDAAGRFSLDKIAPNNTLENAAAQLDGFSFVSGGKAEKSGDKWTLSDIVMQPLNGKISGRVLASDGKPAVGAFVVADGVASKLTPTGANGNFTLTGLPLGEVALTAFSGADGARQKIAVNENGVEKITLQLAAPPALKPSDVDRGFAILSRVLADSAGKEFYARNALGADMEPFDHDLAAVLREKTGVPDGGAERELGALIFENPAQAVVQADSLLPRIEAMGDAPMKTYLRVMLGVALAPSDAPRAAEILARSEADLKALPDATRDANAYISNLNYATTAALAARLGKPSAEGWIDLAMIGAEKQFGNDAKQLVDFKRLLAEIAARGSLQLFEREAREIPLPQQTQALSGAIVDVSQTDLPLARQLLEKLAAMQKNAPDENTRASTAYAFGRAAKSIIARLGESDPAAALKLARRVTDDQSRAPALALAARVQTDGSTRETLFREALTEAAQRPWADSSSGASIAAMAGEVDAALGEKLLRELLQKAISEPAPENGAAYSRTSKAALAFHAARYDAGAARKLIEDEYARLRRIAPQPDAYQMAPLALAMSAIDVDRALDMARALPDGNARYDTQRKIAQYVLADEQTRRTLSFDRWNASDNWRPGTPTRW